jgi:hypothetical protein
MLQTVYKWERKQYERDGKGCRWHELRDERQTLFITPEWFEEKTGANERRFWRAIGATFKVRECGGYTTCESVRPDGCARFCECFEPIDIDVNGIGYREAQALNEAESMRVIPILENTAEHVVLQFGEDTRADYDIITGRWCG